MALKDYFKGKRVAVIGLGKQGEMVEDVKFLIKSGALVGVYDIKSEARLKSHLLFLRSVGLANYVCGSIPAEDLLDMDLIVLSHEYPRNSSFLAGVGQKGIPIEYPETLFFKQAPPITVIGVMGECGKSTVMSMLSPLLEKAVSAQDEQNFFVADPESRNGVLSHLKKIKNGDLVLMRIMPVMMPELTRMRMSPQVAIFTTVPGKGSFDKWPFEILAYQTYNNYIVASDEVIDLAKNYKDLPRAKMLRTATAIVPTDWNVRFESDHDRKNAALALQAARLFKLEDDDAKHILSLWKPLKGRLELVKKVKNIEFYNDGASERACSTAAALKALTGNKNSVLVLGGAKSDCDYRSLYELMPRHVHTVVLVPGSGTLCERRQIGSLPELEVCSVPSIEEAARIALEKANKGDKVIFSPGFEAVGPDGSRKERGERFVRAVRAL